MPRNAHDRPRLALRAEVAVEGKPVPAPVPVVIQKEGPEHLLADASPEVRLVVRQVVRKVVLAAADGVDAGKRVLGVRAPRAGLARLVGIEISVQRECLPAEVPRDVQQQALVAITAVGDGTVRRQARRRGRNPKTRQPSRARNAEAAFVVAATLRQDVDGGRRVRLARHKIDRAAVGVWPVDGRLRAADHLHPVQRLGGNVREIEVAAEAVHRHPIDLHQVEGRISAADEQPRQPPGGARLAEGQARHFPQQVDRQRLVALADLLARNNADAAALFAGRDIDGGADHPHRIDLRRNLEPHGNFAFQRQRLGAESRRGDDQLRARSFRSVQFETAAE